MSAHTPGPWIVSDPRKSQASGKDMYGIDGPEVVDDWEDWGFTEADARLIAAAPELLAALENIVEMNPALSMGMIEPAQDAIAKATGRTG